MWSNLGELVDYDTQSYIDVKGNSISIPQVWGKSYCYSIQANDGFGTGEFLNLTSSGTLEPDGKLGYFRSSIEIANLRFRERKDDLVFNWEVVDQDGNLVDINQYISIYNLNYLTLG